MNSWLSQKKWVAEDEIIVLDALKWLKATRKYMCKSNIEDNSIVMCNKVENE